MNMLERRLLHLEAVAGRRLYRNLSDEELDAASAAVLADWLVAEPDACPRDVLAEVRAFVAAHDTAGRP